MKRVLFTIVLLLAAVPVFAQDAPKNVIAVSAIYNRAGVDVKVPNRDDFRYDGARDSVGGDFSYTRFLGDSPFGIGIETGVALHNKELDNTPRPCGTGCTWTEGGDRSKVAVAYANYTVYLQKRSGTFQPFAKGLVGVQRGTFDGIVFTPGGSFSPGGSQFVYGGGAGVDLCFGAKKSKCWRNGLNVTKAFGNNTSQVDVRIQTGIAFKF